MAGISRPTLRQNSILLSPILSRGAKSQGTQEGGNQAQPLSAGNIAPNFATTTPIPQLILSPNAVQQGFSLVGNNVYYDNPNSPTGSAKQVVATLTPRGTLTASNEPLIQNILGQPGTQYQGISLGQVSYLPTIGANNQLNFTYASFQPAYVQLGRTLYVSSGKPGGAPRLESIAQPGVTTYNPTTGQVSIVPRFNQSQAGTAVQNFTGLSDTVGNLFGNQTASSLGLSSEQPISFSASISPSGATNIVPSGFIVGGKTYNAVTTQNGNTENFAILNQGSLSGYSLTSTTTSNPSFNFQTSLFNSKNLFAKVNAQNASNQVSLLNNLTVPSQPYTAPLLAGQQTSTGLSSTAPNLRLQGTSQNSVDLTGLESIFPSTFSYKTQTKYNTQPIFKSLSTSPGIVSNSNPFQYIISAYQNVENTKSLVQYPQTLKTFIKQSVIASQVQVIASQVQQSNPNTFPNLAVSYGQKLINTTQSIATKSNNPAVMIPALGISFGVGYTQGFIQGATQIPYLPVFGYNLLVHPVPTAVSTGKNIANQLIANPFQAIGNLAGQAEVYGVLGKASGYTPKYEPVKGSIQIEAVTPNVGEEGKSGVIVDFSSSPFFQALFKNEEGTTIEGKGTGYKGTQVTGTGKTIITQRVSYGLLGKLQGTIKIITDINLVGTQIRGDELITGISNLKILPGSTRPSLLGNIPIKGSQLLGAVQQRTGSIKYENAVDAGLVDFKSPLDINLFKLKGQEGGLYTLTISKLGKNDVHIETGYELGNGKEVSNVPALFSDLDKLVTTRIKFNQPIVEGQLAAFRVEVPVYPKEQFYQYPHTDLIQPNKVITSIAFGKILPKAVESTLPRLSSDTPGTFVALEVKQLPVKLTPNVDEYNTYQSGARVYKGSPYSAINAPKTFLNLGKYKYGKNLPIIFQSGSGGGFSADAFKVVFQDLSKGGSKVTEGGTTATSKGGLVSLQVFKPLEKQTESAAPAQTSKGTSVKYPSQASTTNLEPPSLSKGQIESFKNGIGDLGSRVILNDIIKNSQKPSLGSRLLGGVYTRNANKQGTSTLFKQPQINRQPQIFKQPTIQQPKQLQNNKQLYNTKDLFNTKTIYNTKDLFNQKNIFNSKNTNTFKSANVSKQVQASKQTQIQKQITITTVKLDTFPVPRLPSLTVKLPSKIRKNTNPRNKEKAGIKFSYVPDLVHAELFTQTKGRLGGQQATREASRFYKNIGLSRAVLTPIRRGRKK